jgi:hypothetical protein
MNDNESSAKQKNVDSKIELTNESISYLNETRKWTIFLAILGFIFLGFMVIMSFSFGTLFSTFGGEGINPPFPGFLFAGIYLLMVVIYFFPILYLYKFSSFTKKGLIEKNETLLTLAFKNLKSHYKYIGVFTITILSIYLLALIGVGFYEFFN